MNKVEVVANIAKYKLKVHDINDEIDDINKKMDKLCDMEEEYLKKKKEIEDAFESKRQRNNQIAESLQCKSAKAVMNKSSDNYFRNNPIMDDINHIIKRIRNRYSEFENINKENKRKRNEYVNKLEYYKRELNKFVD